MNPESQMGRPPLLRRDEQKRCCQQRFCSSWDSALEISKKTIPNPKWAALRSGSRSRAETGAPGSDGERPSLRATGAPGAKMISHKKDQVRSGNEATARRFVSAPDRDPERPSLRKLSDGSSPSLPGAPRRLIFEATAAPDRDPERKRSYFK